MRSILRLLFVALGISGFLACEKMDALPFYKSGNAPQLTASTTTIAPVAADSNKVALTLEWTYPEHATDTSNIKYTIEIDSAGKNFSRAYTKVVTDSLRTTFTAKELNTILLNKGYKFNVPVDMEVRVTSSYLNNNERLSSNVITIKMTPYKIPPKVALPTTGKLFIVGSATQGGWDNPVPTPKQEFSRIDETTFGGIFQLNGNSFYLLLPENGSWAHKYAVANNSVVGLSQGGDFIYDSGQDIPGPAAAGLYKIIADFQTGKFTVTPFTQQHGLPDSLYIVGDATPGNWNNPVPVPSQKFTRINATTFELTIPLTSGKKYLLLPENGSWAKKFGDDGATGNTKLAGTFKPEGADFLSPDVSGTYKITVNFLNNTYTLVRQ